MTQPLQNLHTDYPWIRTPLVIGAPMRLIALADLAVEISKAGGIGFIGAGTDVSDLATHLEEAKGLLDMAGVKGRDGTLGVGVGFIRYWGAHLPTTLPLLSHYRPAAAWLFAPSTLSSLSDWSTSIRAASPSTKLWIQIGSVREARDALLTAHPDVLVIQGTDAGGHGLSRGAGLITLVPEVADEVDRIVEREKGVRRPVLVAAGGIVESRSASAAFVLGASGVVMGTRFLAAREAVVSKGYREEVLRASDGGQSTVRTKVYDFVRGTTGWAESHNARGVVNRTFEDAVRGMSEEENKRLYEEEVKKGDEGWGVEGRMTTYAGSGVGLVKEVKYAREIVEEVREGVKGVLGVIEAGKFEV
ncbi:oxidoreductase 2-nitropropane dioxygenase [Periconia macrospinosa]|uniref:Oxidoreductase 2-nitropropane dioxygenase n=1 Tax=Periconia macrospinosa TaxID=97972 RepID=A0A2V1DSH2_9PLEO|nr:oxidoreductase 2-nitropropane dioxygenase [Periconia macrospinosa]